MSQILFICNSAYCFPAFLRCVREKWDVRVGGAAQESSVWTNCSYGKQRVTWANSAEAVRRKGRERNKERA